MNMYRGVDVWILILLTTALVQLHGLATVSLGLVPLVLIGEEARGAPKLV
jgi:hypothetical protein